MKAAFTDAEKKGRAIAFGYYVSDSEIGIERTTFESNYNGISFAECYAMDVIPLNLSDKDQSWFGLKNSFCF